MTRKFVGVTVDPDKVDELCLAVGLVEGVEIVRISIPIGSLLAGYFYGDTILNSLVSFFG